MTISATTQGLRMGVATSTSRPTVPFDGQVISETDTDSLKVYNGSAWIGVGKVLQVVSTAKTDTFSTASATFVDVTGMSVSITPQSATSKILVMVQGNSGNLASTSGAMYALFCDSTQIHLGDAASNRQRTSTQVYSPGDNKLVGFGLTFLHSPATTSATTYKLQIRTDLAGTVYFNRSQGDGDLTSNGRAASTITVMEISA